jgi:hypothetical protein
MLVVELYFLAYRIPRLMTQLARARRRSALAWSLLAIGVWLTAEFGIYLAFGIIYGLGIAIWGWPERPPGFTILIYIFALAAGAMSATMVERVLRSRPMDRAAFEPPPPPDFG